MGYNARIIYDEVNKKSLFSCRRNPSVGALKRLLRHSCDRSGHWNSSHHDEGSPVDNTRTLAKQKNLFIGLKKLI